MEEMEEKIGIRHIEEGEKEELYKAARNSFSPVLYFFLRLHLLLNSPPILVADNGEKLVGGVILSKITSGSQISGIIDYIFVHSRAAGSGIGPRLLSAGEEFLDQQGAENFLAFVDGYNSPSWKMFHRQDYEWISLLQQFKKWGIYTPIMWVKSFYFLALGHFLLCRETGEETTAGPGLNLGKPVEILLVLTVISIMSWLAMDLDPVQLVYVFPAVLLNFLVYEGLEWLAAKKMGAEPELRIWEQGITLNVVIGFFGGYLPAHGSVYIKDDEHNYLKQPQFKGKMALSAVTGGFLLTLFFVLRGVIAGAEGLSVPASISLNYYLWQAVIIFPPFQVFKGRQIYRWNRRAWLASLLGLLLLLLIIL